MRPQDNKRLYNIRATLHPVELSHVYVIDLLVTKSSITYKASVQYTKMLN